MSNRVVFPQQLINGLLPLRSRIWPGTLIDIKWVPAKKGQIVMLFRTRLFLDSNRSAKIKI